MFFEEEYRKIIEQQKKNEDYAVMRTICENIIEVLKENGVKVDGTIVKNVTRTETLAIVDDFDVKFNGLDFTEHDKRYVEEIKALKKQISELESELEMGEKAFNHIRDCSKRQFDKNKKLEKESKSFRDEAQKQSWRVSELDRAVCVKTDLLKKANEKIAELESELSVKEDLLKIAMKFNRTPEENMKLVDLFEDCEEEPLPFSCDEYEECLEEELDELRDRHQQDCITINQLHTTIDTLIDRYAKSMGMRGL